MINVIICDVVVVVWYDDLVDDDVRDLIVGSDPMYYECLTPRTHRLYCCG